MVGNDAHADVEDAPAATLTGVATGAKSIVASGVLAPASDRLRITLSPASCPAAPGGVGYV